MPGAVGLPAVIMVADTGPGAPVEALPCVFEPLLHDQDRGRPQFLASLVRWTGSDAVDGPMIERVTKRVALIGRVRARRWLAVLLAVGAVLAVALLVQTVVNYRYVADSLIQQSARRAAEDRVRDVERATRLMRPQDSAGYQLVLDEIRDDAVDQIAAIALLQADGTVVAESRTTGTAPPSQTVQRDGTLSRESRDGRTVFVGTFNCRCTLPRRNSDPSGQSGGSSRLQLYLALYEDSLSAPFSRLRRNAIISAAAALTLLIALTLIGVRARTYMEGRQLQAEAELARSVQLDLLPGLDRFSSADVSAACVAASEVGGDFYDVAALPGGRVSFVVGDVSGHGLSAALLMALIHGAMSNPPWGASESPADAAARLNALLLAKSSAARFASLFWCAYDPGRLTLSYLNAGHPPALLLRKTPAPSGIERLSGGGPVLGLIAGSSFVTQTVEVQAGDVLIVMSDGITEAPDRRGNHFGDSRLMPTVEQARDLPAKDIRDAILNAVSEFTEGRPAPDDRTLLVVRFWNEAKTS